MMETPLQGDPLPIRGDPSHLYVGRDERGDVWQLYDATQDRVLEWAVTAGDDSRAIIWSTMRDLGPPSIMTIAQRPSTYTETETPPPGGTTTPPGSTMTTVTRIYHPVTNAPIDVLSTWTFVGYDSAQNPVFQLVDAAGVVKQWTIDGAGAVKNLINAVTLGVMVTTTPPPAVVPPGGTLPGGSTTTTAGSNNAVMIGVLIALGFVLFANS